MAYDCELAENVMLIPWILVMAGDNPMQSEFASHIGLSGTCFCHACSAKGADKQNRPPGDEGEYEYLAEFLQVGTGAKCYNAYPVNFGSLFAVFCTSFEGNYKSSFGCSTCQNS